MADFFVLSGLIFSLNPGHIIAHAKLLLSLLLFGFFIHFKFATICSFCTEIHEIIFSDGSLYNGQSDGLTLIIAILGADMVPMRGIE